MHKNAKFIICAIGIFALYFYYGILMEKVTKGKYTCQHVNDEGVNSVKTETYKYSLALVFLQCFISYSFAKGVLYYWPQNKDKTPHYYYGGSALTYLIAMVCSNMALQWVSFPTQVIGKAVKPIPVMILGVLIGKKSYAVKKYFFILLIVAGVVLFMYKDKATTKINESTFGIGEVLLLIALCMDGLLGAIQERMIAETQPTAQQMMMNMNLWSFICIIPFLLMTGEATQFIEFVSKYPTVLTNICLLTLAGTIGHLFIFYMVSEFGPLPCAIVTTTRKFFTVLASVIIFSNPLSVLQWIGVVGVFAGLFLDTYYSKSAPKKNSN